MGMGRSSCCTDHGRIIQYVSSKYAFSLTIQDLAGYRQQDAHEYFQSLLNHLHSSEVSPKERTTKNCSCIYHQTFFGRLRSTVTCLKCKNITTAEDPIIDLSLDLRNQVKRRKLEPKVITGEEPLELSGCLKNFTSPEKLGPDAYTCKSPECGGHPQRSRKHLTIKRLPPALCIQLKVRGTRLLPCWLAQLTILSAMSTTRSIRKKWTRSSTFRFS